MRRPFGHATSRRPPPRLASGQVLPHEAHRLVEILDAPEGVAQQRFMAVLIPAATSDSAQSFLRRARPAAERVGPHVDEFGDPVLLQPLDQRGQARPSYLHAAGPAFGDTANLAPGSSVQEHTLPGY